MTLALPSQPPIGVADTITVLRRRYPEALICAACGRLLATRRESYSSSALSDAARLAYVCFECRQEAAEAQRVHAVRLEVAQRAAEASASARRVEARNPRPGVLHSPDADSLTGPAVYAGIRVGFRVLHNLPANSKRRGGRPRKHRNDRARWAAAQRAWRTRQKAAAQVAQQAGLA